ncbi:hypothetical protein GGH94_002966 [Coemansia aciculifera]|uniref:Major facilitator superfamily (MFS) profile domain-containing protein n=1 Tax=Coemansia aciculifera TaxID=417176 RepID=A0A9W8IHY6_9FUNG|nr:hypothetical protein GGH94_002966 [Coemansia aciculifera]
MTAETTAANSIEMLHSDTLQDGQRIAESHISTDMELEDTEIPQARYLLTLLAMSACIFVAGLDFTAVAAITPSVGLQYSKLSTVNWLITANMLGLAVMLPLVSKLGNIFGYQIVFGAYGLVFIAGSAMAGASTGMKLLLAGRAFAGMGASAAIVIPLMVVTEAGSRRQRALGLRVLLAAWLLASVLGLVIGGYLCKHENWNWVFYLSCLGYSVALLLSIMLVRLPKSGSGPLLQQVKRIDILGMLFLTGGILTLILALNLGGNIFNWSSGVVIVLFVLAAFLAVLFFLVEAKVAVDPIMPMSLLSTRSSALLIGMQPLVGIVTYAPVVYLILWLSIVKHDNPQTTCTHLLAIVASAAVLSVASGLVISKTGQYTTLIYLSCAFLTLGCGLLILLKESTSNGSQIGFMILLGIGVGLTTQPHIIALQAAAPAERISRVISSILFFRLIGATVAIALFNTILQANLTTKLAAVVINHPLYFRYILDSTNNQDVIRLPVVPQSVRDAVIDANVQGFKTIYITCLVFAAVTIPLCLFVRHIPISDKLNMSKR